jgi:hypothetical protein
VRLSTRAAAILAVTSLAIALAPLGRAPAASAALPLSLPKDSKVEVTGYSHVGLDGSSGPVTVVAHGVKAENLRAALEGAPTFKTSATCMEDLEPFVITITPSRRAQPRVVAQAFGCGGPGVELLVKGKLVTDITDDCAIQASVVAALPRGQAAGTREQLGDSCTSISPSCQKSHVSLRLPAINQTPSICLVSGATVSLTFDKSDAALGASGAWGTDPVQVYPDIMSISSTEIEGPRLTASLKARLPGYATVRAVFDQLCTAGSTTPCTVPPLGIFDVYVTVVNEGEP